MLHPVIDQMARDDANSALSLIASHERVCTERQGTIITRLTSIEKKFNAAVAGLVGACGVVIVGLLATCWELLQRLPSHP